MLKVKAIVDIHSKNGLLIAKSGTVGAAERNPVPRSPDQYGKLLITFNGRNRAYWCSNDFLEFQEKDVCRVNLSDYRAQRSEHDPFVGALQFPSFNDESKFHFGANLFAFRNARRLSQTELAARMTQRGLETAQSTICFREKASDNPSGDFVRTAAEVLRVPPFAFFIDLKKPRGYRRLAKFLDGVSSSVCEA